MADRENRNGTGKRPGRKPEKNLEGRFFRSLPGCARKKSHAQFWFHHMRFFLLQDTSEHLEHPLVTPNILSPDSPLFEISPLTGIDFHQFFCVSGIAPREPSFFVGHLILLTIRANTAKIKKDQEKKEPEGLQLRRLIGFASTRFWIGAKERFLRTKRGERYTRPSLYSATFCTIFLRSSNSSPLNTPPTWMRVCSKCPHCQE